MGGIAKPLVLNDPTTGKPQQVIPLSTTGYNVTDPGPDYTNPSAVAQATNNPTALPSVTPPAGAPPAAPPPAPAPTTGPAAAPAGGLLSSPGAYEEWIKSHIDQLDTPTRNESLYDSGGASALDNSPLNNFQPTQTDGYSAWLAAQGGAPSATNSSDVLSGLSHGPTSGPTVGYSADVLGGLSNGPSSGPTVGASADILSGLTHGPTSGPTIGASADVLGSLATGPSNSTDVYHQASGELSDPGAAESFNALYGGDNGDLMSPGYTEQLYKSGIGQLDPYYDYASKRAIQAAQTASSARGGFNSGLAAQQESDILGNLRGQQAQEWVNLAPQADAAKIAREGLGSTIANNAQTQQDQRINTLSDAAAAGDAADLGRNALRVTSANNTDQNSTSAYNAFWNSLNNANSNLLTGGKNVDDASLSAFNDYWNATNDAAQNRVSAGANADTAANNAFSNEWTARNNAGSNLVSAGANADQSAINAFNAGSNAQNNSGTLALNQYLANLGLAQDQDASTRANVQEKFNLASGADTSQLGRFGAEAGLAKDLQTTGQNRILGGLGAISGEASQEAQITQQVLSDTKGIDQMDDTQLQALADKYGVSLDELKSVEGDATAVVGLLTKAATGGAGGGGGGSIGANGSPIID